MIGHGLVILISSRIEQKEMPIKLTTSEDVDKSNKLEIIQKFQLP